MDDNDELLLAGLWSDMSLPLLDESGLGSEAQTAAAAAVAYPAPAAAPALPQSHGSLQPVWAAHQGHQHQTLSPASSSQMSVGQPGMPPQQAPLTQSSWPAQQQQQQQQQQGLPAPMSVSAEGVTAAPGPATQRKRSHRSTTQEGAKRGLGRADISQQVSELEQVYQQKLRALKALTATHHELAEKAWVMEQLLSWHDGLAAHAAELQSGTIQPFKLLGLTNEEVMQATPQRVLDMMKNITMSLGQELMAYELSGIITPKLAQLQRGLTQACTYMTVMRPDLMLYTSMHVDAVVVDASNQGLVAAMEQMPHPPPDHWQRVAAALKLQPRSLARAHILHQLAKGWQERIQAERRALTNALNQVNTSSTAAIGMGSSQQQAASMRGSGFSGRLTSGSSLDLSSSGSGNATMDSTTTAAAAPPHCAPSGGSDNKAMPTPAWPMLPPGFTSQQTHTPADGRCLSHGALRFLYAETSPEEPILDRLSANLDKERRVVSLVADVMWMRLFNEIESCRALVHSYPWVPDDLMILTALSQLHTQASGTIST